MRVQEKNKESIFSFLDRQARMRPNETAFVLLGERYELVDTITYKELYRQSCRIAFFSIEKQKAILLYRCLNNQSVV